VTTLLAELRDLGLLGTEVQGDYLLALHGTDVLDSQLDYFVERVAGVAQLRRDRDTAHSLLAALDDANADHQAAVKRLVGKLGNGHLPGGISGGRPLVRYDLAELARQGVKPPEFTADGYLYRGAVHSIAGPPDSGKTTLVCWWARQLLRDGQPVMYLDEEAGPELFVEKLLALGVEPDDLAHLHYYPFQGRSWDDADLLGLRAAIAEARPVLLIADSMSAMLAAGDRDEDKARDVRRFVQRVLVEPAREFRFAAAYVDHVTKDEKAGRYARGSGDKLAVVDVAYKIEPVKAFHRDQPGLFRLKVSKDRRGYLHRAHEVRVKVADELLWLEIVESDEASGSPTEIRLKPSAAKVLEILRASPVALSKAQIGDAAAEKFSPGLRSNTIAEALGDLSQEGLVDELEPGPRGKKFWQAISE
jgi:hypothetical protein